MAEDQENAVNPEPAVNPADASAVDTPAETLSANEASPVGATVSPTDVSPAASEAPSPDEAPARAAAQVQPAVQSQAPQAAATLAGQGRRREFPPYTRSLLRVSVPVVVTLAEKKQTLGRILEIGPGQILQFDKSCDEDLDLEVSNCKIATGEAIKVGDKFGLRIISIVPPDERFVPVTAAGKR